MMKRAAMRFWIAAMLVLLTAPFSALMRAGEEPKDLSPDPRFRVGERLLSDDFTHGATQWLAELEKGGEINAREGKLVIDVPGGCTLWFRQPLDSPVMIRYAASVINQGGPNDRLSDLNCFWMARDARNPADLFAVKRGGKFSDYDQLRCYYVGFGGNNNTTTRFRRYIGEASNRPLLREHDLSDPQNLLLPNVLQEITLVADGPLIQFYRDGKRVFEMNDAEPYTSGWFGFRTVSSHLQISAFRVYRLHPATAANDGSTAK